jgi:hypothetical protein
MRAADLIRSLIPNREADQLLAIAQDYRAVVFEQKDLLARKDAEIFQLKLEYSRWGRAVVENFLTAQENGIDLRDALLDALRDFDDEVARLEEHAPV